MGAEIIKVYTEEMPAVRFIGKKYLDADRVDGGFGQQWGTWHENGWFNLLLQQFNPDEQEAVATLTAWFHEGAAYLGLMRVKENEPFEYWIGMFLPAETTVPEGMNHLDFPAMQLGIGWIRGTMENIFFMCEPVYEQLVAEGFQPVADKNGAWWSFERYTCPRFTNPDEEGQIILDHGYFLRIGSE